VATVAAANVAAERAALRGREGDGGFSPQNHFGSLGKCAPEAVLNVRRITSLHTETVLSQWVCCRFCCIGSCRPVPPIANLTALNLGPPFLYAWHGPGGSGDGRGVVLVQSCREKPGFSEKRLIDRLNVNALEKLTDRRFEKLREPSRYRLQIRVQRFDSASGLHPMVLRSPRSSRAVFSARL
jgi:hypothetical protein